MVRVVERYPAEPLERVALGPDRTALELARRLGVSSTQLYRMRREGVTWSMADKLACRLGLHPGLVWPEWLEVGIARFVSAEREREESAKAYGADWRERHRDQAREYSRAYYRRNRGRMIAQAVRAKRRRRARETLQSAGRSNVDQGGAPPGPESSRT